MTPDNAPFFSPWVEISLDNLVHNLNQVRSLLPPSTGIMAVVKDNAYGCGAVMISRALESHGVDLLAVARAAEARTLRDCGIRLPILVLGPASGRDMVWGAQHEVQFTLNDLADFGLWEGLGCPIRFHAAIDTGMGRLGLAPAEACLLPGILRAGAHLQMEGIFTHLAKADDPDAGAISRQLALFRKVLRDLEAQGVSPRYVHYANSAAILRYPLEECTLVRPGISLYGCKPDPAQDFPLDLKPVLGLKALVVKIKAVGAATPVSYGGTYITPSDTFIATIALGYGQGLPRRLGNRGCVLVRGKRFAIAGRVTMDYIMIDAGGNSGMAVGDEAVAIGCQGPECIFPDEVALLCDTIGYEICCGVSPLIDRLYILDGKIIRREPARPF